MKTQNKAWNKFTILMSMQMFRMRFANGNYDYREK